MHHLAVVPRVRGDDAWEGAFALHEFATDSIFKQPTVIASEAKQSIARAQ